MWIEKVCTKCGRSLPATTEYFYKSATNKDGLYNVCKICHLERCKNYRNAHREEYNLWHRTWRSTRMDKETEGIYKWRSSHKDHWDTYSRQWRDEHKEHLRELKRKYTAEYRRDPKNRICKSMGSSMRDALHDMKSGRHWEELAGYTLDDLMAHLESKFLPGMTFENYGKFGWHIDHIRPIDSFQFESCDDPEFKECFSLKNLQPLWAHDNLSKGAKYSSNTYQKRKEVTYGSQNAVGSGT